MMRSKAHAPCDAKESVVPLFEILTDDRR
jgi:hypothetical protein